jgi:hypothetical protein
MAHYVEEHATAETGEQWKECSGTLFQAFRTLFCSFGLEFVFLHLLQTFLVHTLQVELFLLARCARYINLQSNEWKLHVSVTQ